MNDDPFGGDWHAWVEPELEARIVAMILGEASDFETDALERLMEEHPELRIFKRRLEIVHELLGEAVKARDSAKWRLAPERRAEVLERIGAAPVRLVDEVVVPIEVMKERRVRRAGLKVALMAAACLMISLLLAPFFMSGGKMASVPKGFVGVDSEKDEEGVGIVSYNGPSTRKSELSSSHGMVLDRSERTDGRRAGEAGNGPSGEGNYWYRNGRLEEKVLVDALQPERDVRATLAALKESIGTSTAVLNDSEALEVGGVVLENKRPVKNRPRPAGKPAAGPVAVSGNPPESAEASPAPKPQSISRAPSAPSEPKPKPKASAPATKTSALAKSFASRSSKDGEAALVPDLPVAGGVPVLEDGPVLGSLFRNSDGLETVDDFGSGWGDGDLAVNGSGVLTGDGKYPDKIVPRRSKRTTADDRVHERLVDSDFDGEIAAPTFQFEGGVADSGFRTNGEFDDRKSKSSRGRGEKSIEPGQADSGELGFAWVGDEGRKADLNDVVGDDLFVGGGTLGGESNPTTRDFINPVDSATTPEKRSGDSGKPSDITGVKSLRSGDAAVTRNSIDAILNTPNPDQAPAP